MKTYTKKLYIVYLFLSSALFAFAQETGANKTESGDVVSFKERFAFKTNVLDWIATIPNVAVEYDLSDSTKNQMTIGLSLKYNWNTFHNYAPYSVFNYFELRPEFRHYWRTSSRRAGSDHNSLSKKERFYRYAVDHERENPKQWRAYWFGGYANYSNYSFKLTETGIQGYAIGFGATIGYALPRYNYDKGAVDVELGLSMGLQLTEYDKFVHNPIGHYYSQTEHMNLHLTPFPVVSELKFVFAYRPLSVKEKYPYDENMKRRRQNARENKQLQMEESESTEEEKPKKNFLHKITGGVKALFNKKSDNEE